MFFFFFLSYVDVGMASVYTEVVEKWNQQKTPKMNDTSVPSFI